MSNGSRPNDSDVAVAAFHIWEREGRPDGMAEAHWHRARAMLEARETYAQGAAAEAGLPAAAAQDAAAKAAAKPARKRTTKAAMSAPAAPRARKPRARPASPRTSG